MRGEQDKKDIKETILWLNEAVEWIYNMGGAGIDGEPKWNNNVSDAVDVPLIVGGGIRSPETASETIKAGASIIVTGTIIELHSNRMKELADAVHWKE